ncbi:MAG: hypothetical protein CFK52_04430 [Chloracidobacterium sp. CP2_5A]|nr:MAG: hypothetical protein CFK52_04430 [Chloracidobacterium sp. CP2_5A]
MLRSIRFFLVGFGFIALWVSHQDAAYGQYANYLSPGMQYGNMWQANASFILSQSQQNLRMQSVPLRLSGNRQPGGRSAPPSARRSPGAAQSSAPSAPASRDYSATDFRPKRRQNVADQFAALAQDSSHRGPLREFGQAVFNELETNPEFRRNNLTYAIGLALGAALGIERGRELTDDESYFLLDAVHEFLTTGSDVARRAPEEQTALYDTCILFTGLMIAFETDAKENGTPETRRAAREMARATLDAFGFKSGSRR